MQSTQFTLSPADSEAVRQLAQRTGKTEAEVLHEAVEKLMQQAALESWQAALRQVEGMWADHPDAQQLRAEWHGRAERLVEPRHE
jgi:predicted DNA-binding protein